MTRKLRRAGRSPHRFVCAFLILTVAATGLRAFGQARYLQRYEEPEWSKLRITEISVGGYAEGQFDQNDFKNSGTSVTHERVFVGPALGLNAVGSIYHPNLLTYYLNSDGAFGWSRDSFSSPGSSSTRDEWEYLGRIGATVDFLQNKPLHASAFGNYDHTFRDNDFFNRVTVESWRSGARTSLQLGNWNFGLDYMHRDETSSSPFPFTQVVTVTNVVGGTNVVTVRTNKQTLDQKIIARDDTVAFVARNERFSGGTALNYSWSRYTRADAGRLGEGNDHSVSIGDNERFGALEKYKLNTSASYFRRDSSAETSDEVTANLNFNAEHRPHLSSFYDLNYDYFTTGDFDSDSYTGQAALQHQLYESLTSTLLLRGSQFDTSDPTTQTSTTRYGGGFTEVYTKRLSDTARLRLSNALLIDHTDQHIDSQNVLSIKNERHSFSEGGVALDSFFLNMPNVIPSSVVITDEHDSQPPFLENFDYRVIPNGSRTLIERLTGSRIATNAVVFVDYEAEPTPSGSYETVTEAFEIRLEFWQSLLGVYGRVNLSLNNAPSSLRIQNVRAYTVGSDLNWLWLRAGAEYTIYDSSLSEYRSARLFQSLTFRPDAASTFGVEFSEAWIDYTSAHRQEEDFQCITRYHRGLTHHLALDADAGISLRRGSGVDQTLATVRPALKYVVGKTTVDTGYDYEYELFLNNEERQKHMFFVRLKRNF
jgi:hypothetical protein